MKNQKNSFYIEAPLSLSGESQFFLQYAKPYDTSCQAHIHDSIEMLYVNEGSYRVTLDSEEYDISKGDLILFCSNAIHHVRANGDPINSYYVIKVPPSFFLEFSKYEVGSEYIMRFALNRPERKIIWRKDELERSDMLSILQALIEESKDQKYASEIAVKIKIMELLLTILRQGESTEPLPNNQTVELIYDVMLYVRRNYAGDLDEKELAKNIGMSYSYFSRSFKRVAGMTFKKYLNLTRIHKAEQMLCTSKCSITEVATECGYNSTSYFIDVYKSITGKTPYQVTRSKEK